MSRFLNAQYRSLNAYTPGEQPRDTQYIKLNTNESPYPPAPSVVAAMTGEQVELLRLYSDPTAKGLKEKLAGLYGVKTENVFVSNGSDEVLNFAFMAFGGRGAVFPDISYGFYQVYGDLYHIDYERIPLKEDFSIDIPEFKKANGTIFIANPNAPTGLILSLDEIREILESNKDNIVVIDEAYIDFGGESCYRLINEYDNLLVVQTYSKSRSLAGARLGFGIGSPEIIADLQKIRNSNNPYNINRFTQALGAASILDTEYFGNCTGTIIENREFLTQELEKRGFEVIPSKANFIFAKHNAKDGKEIYTKLKNSGVLVRHFDKERISMYNRITIGSMTEIEKLLEAIDNILERN